jgi:hypothetical protein
MAVLDAGWNSISSLPLGNESVAKPISIVVSPPLRAPWLVFETLIIWAVDALPLLE